MRKPQVAKKSLDLKLPEFRDPKSNQAKVMGVLKDKKWHCRHHEYQRIKASTAQLAGGGGIQGLQRRGFVIESKSTHCEACNRVARWDRWTGRVERPCVIPSFPRALAERVLELYAHSDAIEQRKRPSHQLVIDHKFPLIRWGQYVPPTDPNLPNKEIVRHFQLLKKDHFGDHNLLKSRDCENCCKTMVRGAPFGIEFFYEGDARWPVDIPPTGPSAEKGCCGCGWYDFQVWRQHLNSRLALKTKGEV